MKIYSQLKKALSLIMVFCIIMEAAGCYSTRILTPSEITQSDQYLIHNKESIYSAYDIAISDGILSGKLDFNKRQSTESRNIHIYLFPDSSPVLNNDQFSIPVGSIKEIKKRVRDQEKTKTLTTVLIIGAGVGLIAVATFGIIGIIQMAKTPIPDPDETCQKMEELELCSDGSPD